MAGFIFWSTHATASILPAVSLGRTTNLNVRTVRSTPWTFKSGHVFSVPPASQSTMDTTALPPGIYRIAVAGVNGVEPACLTRNGVHGITILPPSAHPDHDQEWQIVPGRNGNIIIERPSKIFPNLYLTYKGAPKKPEEGERIVDHLSEFPPNEWHVVIAPGFRSLIHVAGSDLGIRVAPPRIHPPFLELGHERQLQWVFERVRHE